MKSIKVSIDALAPDQARRFAELAVFPPDETVPEAAVATLWSHTGPMKEREARRLLTVLERRALVRLDREAAEVGDDPTAPCVAPRPHLRLRHPSRGDRVALHQQMLDAYSQRCPEGWPSGPNDGYFFQHLRHHLVEAGRDTELTSLLLDLAGWKPRPRPAWSSTWPWTSPGPWSAIPIDHGARQSPAAARAKALRSDLHFLARHPTALFQCLWNRCWWYDCPDAAAHYDPPRRAAGPPKAPPWSRPAPDRLSTLLEAWREAKESRSPGFVWLRSLRPPELALGSPQLACLRGHEGGVNERGVFARRPPHRQRVGGPDGAGVGCGQRHGARLPPRT